MNSKPFEYTNTAKLNEVCLPSTKVMMLRYEEMFNFYSVEPSTLRVKKDNEHKTEIYEQIFRMRKWNEDGLSHSWSLYCNMEEEFPSEKHNFVIRRVIWDLKYDKDNVRENIMQSREELLLEWPTIHSDNIWLDTKYSERIVSSVIALDKELEQGVKICENDSPSWKWRDIEIYRKLDWGSVKLCWSNNMENKHIEKCLMHIESILNHIAEEAHEEVCTIELNYSMLPERWKSIVTSGEASFDD